MPDHTVPSCHYLSYPSENPLASSQTYCALLSLSCLARSVLFTPSCESHFDIDRRPLPGLAFAVTLQGTTALEILDKREIWLCIAVLPCTRIHASRKPKSHVRQMYGDYCLRFCAEATDIQIHAYSDEERCCDRVER